jgi:fermentation-respiration switch protein FrsA (DUF1100 family)
MKSRRIFATYTLALFIGLSGLLSGCRRDKDEVKPGNQYLVDSTLIGEFSKESLIERYGSTAELLPLIQYGVRVYKITYRTTYVDGTPIVASGAVMIPLTDAPVSLISYQHGTITPESENRAPSYYYVQEVETVLTTLFATSGNAVIAPDYIGYGASKNVRHPYEHASSLASASLDMLRAAKEFFAQKGVKLNDKTFLTGYSEGGGATVALQKLIEEKHPEVKITATAPLAGAYHKSKFIEQVASATSELEHVNVYLWVVNTYNWIYRIDRPYSYYYQSPWAATIEQNVFSNTNLNPSTLFTETFRKGILEKTDAPMLAAFRDNDLYNWKPKAPMLLIHGTADDYVPFYNSQDAYNAMRTRGGNVTLFPVEGADHFSVLPAYLSKTIEYFKGF